MSGKPTGGVAFGSQSARFSLSGIHPNLLATGKMPYDQKNISQSVGLFYLTKQTNFNS